MAVPLHLVKESNQRLSSLKPGLVGVFVGGTSGIGEFTLKAFAKYTTAPKIYIVGRNESAAARISEEAKKLNASSETTFIKIADASLLGNVDVACKEIQAREEAINVLFLTTGYLTLEGRRETTEGIDRKYSLNYYSRMRFVHNLLPQLTAGAAQPNSVSRVVSVLGAGHEAKIYEDDLDLKRNFSLGNCAAHTITLTSFAVEELAKAHPATAFVHTSPGAVKTGVMDHSGALLKALAAVAKVAMTFMFTSPDECGERHLFAATAPRYASKAAAGEDAAVGSDGTKASGAYLLDPVTKSTGNEKILAPLRQKGFGKTAWEHTLAMFKLAEESQVKS